MAVCLPGSLSLSQKGLSHLGALAFGWGQDPHRTQGRQGGQAWLGCLGVYPNPLTVHRRPD